MLYISRLLSCPYDALSIVLRLKMIDPSLGSHLICPKTVDGLNDTDIGVVSDSGLIAFPLNVTSLFSGPIRICASFCGTVPFFSSSHACASASDLKDLNSTLENPSTCSFASLRDNER